MISLNLCGAGRIRTYEAEAPDLQSGGFNHSPTSPIKIFDSSMESYNHLVEDIGVEPMTYCVQGNCSSQLS